MKKNYTSSNPKLLQLEHWLLACEVLREKSIIKVAMAHNMDRSQLSRLLSQLENELGFELITRHGRRLEPTQLGLAALNELEQPLLNVIEGLERLTNNAQSVSGNIRIGGMPGFMQTQVVPLLVEFQKIYPGVSFDVTGRDDRNAFMNGQADVMFYYGPVHKEKLVEYWVSHSAFIPCASPKYLAKAGTPLNPDELTEHAGITYIANVRPHSEHLESANALVRYRFKSEIRFNNILTAMSAALEGGGILIDLPLHHGFREIVNGNLVPILKGWHVPNLENYLACTKEAAKLKRVQLFIEWYIERRREIESYQQRYLREHFG